MSAHGMARTVVWTELCQAIIKDGLDVRDGRCGPAVAEWIGRLAGRELCGMGQLYEDLREAIDNGHESMTHSDAVAWVQAAHARLEAESRERMRKIYEPDDFADAFKGSAAP
jgi:hypothetical protein